MIRGIFKLTTIMIALFLFMGAAGCNFPIEYDEGTYETDIFETSQEDNTCSGEPQNEKCYDSAYDMDADCYMTDMAADSVCGYTLKNDYSQEEFEKWLAEYPWDCDDSDPDIWADCPASDDVLISEPTPTKTIESRPTATEPPLTRPTPTETPAARPTLEPTPRG